MKTPVEERAAPAAAAFRVGPWRVEPALHRLERGGETVRVEPKVMEVLVHLAARPGAVVSREELQAAVWGTPYVSEDLPRRAVYELRKVLGDDARRPDLIETIPRSGYRLVAPVVRLGPGEGGEDRAGEAAAATETAPPRWRRLVPPLALGLLAAAALSLGLLRGGHGPAAPSGFEVRPLTTDPGLEYDPAFSPDGSRVAFLRTPDPRLNAAITLHVQLVGAESSLEVSEGPADFDHPIESPAWSPDGTAIAYRRWRREDGWGIYRVPALGGAERKLADLGRVGTSGLAWSPDGRWLAFGLRAGGDGPLALHRLDLETGARERLTRPPGTIQGDQLPAWSPDGRRLAFVRTVDADASELRVVPAGGGRSRSLLPERHKIADVDWTPDGRRLVVAVSDGG
ncbi:MAG TPA: winged helix-turn-helix domain-containing protein, partial [Thermoanaerobaculia bacterium]